MNFEIEFEEPTIPVIKPKTGVPQIQHNPSPSLFKSQQSTTAKYKISNILDEKIKNLRIFVPVIDNKIGKTSIDGKNYEGGFEEGINILYGAVGGGKTTLALQLTLEAKRLGYKVRYVDIEHTIRRERVLQLWNSLGKPCKKHELNDIFIRLTEWDFNNFTNIWTTILQVDKPDLFIVDSLSPIFLEKFFSERAAGGGDTYDTLGKRDLLATTTLKYCNLNHTIVIIIGHERGFKTENRSGVKIEEETEEFTGIGRRFSYLAKMHLWMGYLTDGARVLGVIKHRFMDSDFKTTTINIDKLARFKITNRGIEGI
jgi:archaellum biogenesis ATPase FlaH